MRVFSYIMSLQLFAFGAYAAEFTFTSRLDHFVVEVNDNEVIYNGKPVDAEPFVYIKPLFDAQLETTCDPDMGRPDLTISRRRDNKEEKRKIYIEKKMISDGEHCGGVTGHGLYQLPLHHNWFEGKKNVTIGLGSAFSIWKDNLLISEFEKTSRGWRNKNPKFFTNWKFFEKFVDSMQKFPVDFRVHPLAAKESIGFELRQGDRKFGFFKVGEHTWAVQFPDSPWLAASGQFGFFDDMKPEIWLSPYVKSLDILADKTDVHFRLNVYIMFSYLVP